MTERWFCIETKPNSERRARHHLKQQGFTVFLPEYLKVSRHARKVTTVRAAYWPRYVFAYFDRDISIWGPIRNTPGVLRMISTPTGSLMPVPEGIIEDLQRRSAANGGAIKMSEDELDARFRRGDRVRVVDGPFTSFDGKVQKILSKTGGRYAVLLEIFGRLTPCELLDAQIELAA